MATIATQGGQVNGGWLRMAEAAELASMSVPGLRHRCNAGEIETRRTIGGQRLVSRASLIRAMGLDIEDEPTDDQTERRICLYLRVSSQAQARDGNLERQRERMIEWACERFGCSPDGLLLVQDVASAFGTRTGLQRVVDAMLDGRLSHVCFEFDDRWSRTSSEKRLLEHLAERCGVELVPVKETITGDEKDYFVKELVDFVTVIANKVSGAKGGESVRIEITPEVKDRILALRAAGLNQNAIVEQLAVEGFQCPKHEKPYAIHTVRTVLAQAAKLNALVTPTAEPDTLLDRFIAERCDRSEGVKCLTREFHQAYARFAEAHGQPAPSAKGLTYTMQRKGWTIKRHWSGHREYVGLGLGE